MSSEEFRVTGILRTLQVWNVLPPGCLVGEVVAKYEVFISFWSLSHVRRISWGKKPETSHMSHDDISG